MKFSDRSQTTKVASRRTHEAPSSPAFSMESLTYRKKHSAEKDRSGESLIEVPKEPVRTMPDFAKALRADMAPDRYSVEVPVTWSASENITGELNDFAMELNDYEIGSILGLESTANLTTNDALPIATKDALTVLPKKPELEQVSQSVAIPQQTEDSASEPDRSQLSAIPADWEQAVSKAKPQDEMLDYEEPEWIKLPVGGGWWKGNMTWI